MFDKIEFRRLGPASDKKLKLEIHSNVAQRQGEEEYKVTLTLQGNKPDEYIFEISLTGYFALEESEELLPDIRKALVTKNTVAILMPYLRSEVSLLTAQPGVECVVLPAFNINGMLAEEE